MNSKVVEILAKKGLKIAFAESCTGGMVCQSITSVSGASKVLEYSVCCYSNNAKYRFLGVDSHTLSEYGAVSYQTATEMAERIKEIASSDIGVSVTGLAGPTGDGTDTPVGRVYIGIAAKNNQTQVWECNFNSQSRDSVRQNATLRVLELILKTLEKF